MNKDCDYISMDINELVENLKGLSIEEKKDVLSVHGENIGYELILELFERGVIDSELVGCCFRWFKFDGH
ncbi:hypothetical protein [Enterobacter cloacae complex sp. 418I7]|uniref:hypothetical protein n=1 Tax=Enterobacter cloacae complex sp. 418I7 TaxID=3395839 RepID=UPI003CE699FD